MLYLLKAYYIDVVLQHIAMIYFIKANNRVKIGYSANPSNRINKIQTAIPYDIEVLLIFDGDRDKERELHLRFADSRRKGEWFQFEGVVKDYIDVNVYRDRKYEFGFCYDDFAGNEQIVRLRRQLQIGTELLGDRLNVSQQAVSQLEHRERFGAVSVRNMHKIARALGYKFEYRFIRKQ